MIEDIISIELSYINTNHPDFVGGDLLNKTLMEEQQSTPIEKQPTEEPEQKSGGGFFSSIFGSKPPKKSEKTDPGMQGPPSMLKMDKNLSEYDRKQVALIQQLIKSYFRICQKNIQDIVTKTIMHFLVNTAKGDLQPSLVGTLYKEEVFSELLQEDHTIPLKRKICSDQLEMLKKAKKILQDTESLRGWFFDFNFF